MQSGITGVVLVGHYYNRGGYASLVHDYHKAFLAAGIPCRVVPNGAVVDEVRAEWENDVLASAACSLGPRPALIICDIPPRFRLVGGKDFYKRIGITIFETDRLPTGWADHCNLMDEIWVPSDFNMETFASSGVRPSLLRKVPIGIDEELFDADKIALEEKSRRRLPARAYGKFTFLYLFGLHFRKGFDILLRSYLAEFRNDEDVFLLMSCFPVSSGVQERGERSIREFVLDQSYPETASADEAVREGGPFEILEEWHSNSELRGLYMAADAYVSTERASGWSLPCMEMMAIGKPVAAVDWGGGTEFMNAENAFLIRPGELVPVDERLQRENAWYRGHMWPDLQESEVRAAMRSLFQNSGMRRLKAAAGQETVRSAFSKKAIGQQISALLRFSPEKAAGEQALPIIYPTPRKVEVHETVWERIRAIKSRWPERKIGLVAQPGTSAALMSVVTGSQVGTVTAFHSDLGSAPQAVVDLWVAADGLENEWSQFEGVPIVSFTEDIEAIEELFQRATPACETEARQGRILLAATGKVLDEVWAEINRLGFEISAVLTDSPDQAENVVRSWRGLPVVSMAEAAISGADSVLLGDIAPFQQRRLIELIGLCLPGVAVEPVVTRGQMPTVKDRDSLFKRSVFRHWSGFQAGALGRLVLYPAFDSASLLHNELARIGWFVPAQGGVEILVGVTPDLVSESGHPANLNISDAMGVRPDPDLSHVHRVTERELRSSLGEPGTAAVVWKTSGLSAEDFGLLDLCPNIILTDINDHGMRSGFASAYLRSYCLSRDELWKSREISRRRLLDHLAQNAQARIFGTGPSLAQCLEDDLSGSYNIICNTIVRSRELLDHIKPRLVVAADADFHFGVSAYAARFRSDLSHAVLSNDMLFVCPEAHSHFLAEQMPEIADRVVGIPVAGQEVNLDLKNAFFCGALDNVLLQFLLPLATTVAEDIKLYGFDGKRPGEKKFWNHSNMAQYGDLLDTVEECHPAFFFYRDYQEYFDRHSALIEAVIQSGEALGRRYECRTPSVVPALASRYVPIHK